MSSHPAKPALPSAGSPSALSQRALNRATLVRQLLERSMMPVLDGVTHLVGLRAQTPHSWYVGVWNRVEGVRPENVSTLLERRELVRIALMRSTIHLVTAADTAPACPVGVGTFRRHTMRACHVPTPTARPSRTRPSRTLAAVTIGQ